jgi:hypothetical protein
MLLGARCSQIVRFTDSTTKFGKQRAATLFSAQPRQEESYINE